MNVETRARPAGEARRCTPHPDVPVWYRLRVEERMRWTEIAKRAALAPNTILMAVQAYAKRLGLPLETKVYPGTKRAGGTGDGYGYRARKARTLSVAPEVPAPQRSREHQVRAGMLGNVARRPAQRPAASIARPAALPRARCCQWPEGDPGEPGFRLCGAAPVLAGKPYCAAHAARAYRAPGEADPLDRPFVEGGNR